MLINGNSLFAAQPIKDMYREKKSNGDVSFGMSEAGYDIRIKQDVRFSHDASIGMRVHNGEFYDDLLANRQTRMRLYRPGRFTLASAIEEFQMPKNLVGVVHDKSTWARRGLSVFNTVIEPGWHGFLTLELVYHGNDDLIIPAGSGIAQVLFHKTSDEMEYSGKYQGQPDRPVGPRSR